MFGKFVAKAEENRCFQVIEGERKQRGSETFLLDFAHIETIMSLLLSPSRLLSELFLFFLHKFARKTMYKKMSGKVIPSFTSFGVGEFRRQV